MSEWSAAHDDYADAVGRGDTRDQHRAAERLRNATTAQLQAEIELQWRQRAWDRLPFWRRWITRRP